MDAAKKMMREEELDAAIEASLNESAETEVRGLREAMARLAAASPYMEPPADLRVKILQASAPQIFRMEDYKKATRDNVRFYRWGMVAAGLFLAAAAWFNMNMQSNMKVVRSEAMNALKEQQGQLQAMQAAVAQKDDALKALVDPNVRQVNLMDRDQKVIGKLLVLDAENKNVMVVLPQEMIPPGRSVTLTLSNGASSTRWRRLRWGERRRWVMRVSSCLSR